MHIKVALNLPFNKSTMALILCSLLILFSTVTATPTNDGFTMELIHRYSYRSPHYNPNLTEYQIMKRLMKQSRSYVQELDFSSLVANTTGLIPRISKTNWIYLVKLRIGTTRGIFTRGVTYYLLFDTGSSLTWTQCKPCNPCFQQTSPTFDPRKSLTYKPIHHSHRLCAPPLFRSDGDGNCQYQIRYNDGDTTEGILSEDTFTFKSNGGRRKESVPNMIFGCSYSNIILGNMAHDTDGALGMGRMELSMVNQMHNPSGGRFSYCLVKPVMSPSGFLRFKNEPLRGPVQRTPFEAPMGHYFLTLNDITIADRRLNLPPGTFTRRSNVNGGCIIDTGSVVTHLVRPAYDRVTFELIRYLVYHNLQRAGGFEGMDICYRTPPDYQRILPHMILHFREADYHIGWENLFFINTQQDSFCFAVIPSNTITLLGAFQQHNVRFEYNLVTNMLSFVPENCARDVGH